MVMVKLEFVFTLNYIDSYCLLIINDERSFAIKDTAIIVKSTIIALWLSKC